MALKGGTRFSVRFEDVFPDGCRLVPDSISQVEDYDEKSGRRTPSKDKLTGQRVYQVRVFDADQELGGRSRETTVKISGEVLPVPPVGGFEFVEFDGMTVTPYVANNGRLAYSLRASGLRSPVAVSVKAKVAAS